MSLKDWTKRSHYAELSSHSDEFLMAAVAQGDQNALAILFDRYQGTVLRVGMHVLRNPHEAEDLMQSVFLELMRTAGQFDATKGTARAWILQCVYHRAFDRRRYLGRRGAYDLFENELESSTAAGKCDDEREVSFLYSARLVQQALGQLNDVQRKTLELAFFEGLTMHEIATKTGETFANTRHHYYRGLDKMRSILGVDEKKDDVKGGRAAYVRP